MVRLRNWVGRMLWLAQGKPYAHTRGYRFALWRSRVGWWLIDR